jgi:hypothetical protein
MQQGMRKIGRELVENEESFSHEDSLTAFKK